MNKVEEILSSMAQQNITEPAEEVVETTEQATEDPVEEVVETTEQTNEEEINSEEQSSDSEEEVEEADSEEESSEEAEEDPVEETEKDSNEDGLVEEWDTSEEESEEITQDLVSETVSNIAKELELEEVQDTNDLVTKLKEKINHLQSKEFEVDSVLNDIPDNLAEAVRIAKEGGDFLNYLQAGSFDYSAYSDYDLVANSIANHFVDKEGNVDEQALQDYMDELSDQQLKIEAGRIKTSLDQHNQAVKNKVLQEAQAKRAKRLDSVKNKLESINEISGYKLTPSHKNAITKAFEKESVINELFYGKDKTFDPAKAIDTYFKIKYWDKIESFRRTKTRNETKKQVIDSMTNPEVDTRQQPTKPQVEKDPLADLVRQYRGN